MNKNLLLFILFLISHSAFSNPTDKNLLAVSKGNKWGFINYSGKTIIPFKYQDVLAFDNNKTLVKENNKWGMINRQGKYIIKPDFDSIVEYYNPSCLMMKGNKYYAYHDGQYIDTSYSKINDYGEDVYIVYQGGKCGYVDTLGNKITGYDYDNCWWFSDGLAAVEINDKTGFINEKGEIVLEPQYGGMNSFSEGLAIVRVDGIYSAINKKGEIVYQSDCSIDKFSEGLARVVDYKGKRGYYINKNFEIATPFFPYDYYLCDFENGFAIISNGYKKYGLINRQGKIVVPTEYDFVFNYNAEIDKVMVKADSKLVFYDTLGNVLLKPHYDFDYNSFSEGLCSVGLEGKYGFIDLTCKEVIKPQYDSVCDFSDGLAAVCLNSKWGFIDKNNKLIIPFKYEKVFSFSNGLAAVKLNNKYGFIDKGGKMIIDFNYDDFINYSSVFRSESLDDFEDIEVKEVEEEDSPIYIMAQ